ncbi:MAG: hypothetical protein J2P21_27030 [Chloracidobacterium sp.]|nr:hypothetical protein [Chloracidobacterium sp.]
MIHSRNTILRLPVNTLRRDRRVINIRGASAPAIFAALILLALFGSSCSPAERDNLVEKSTVTPVSAPSGTQPSPNAAPEWLAAGATNKVEDITGSPNAFSGKSVTVVAKIAEIYGPNAFTLNGEGEGGDEAPPFSKDAGGKQNVAGKDLLTLVPKVGGFPNVDDQWKDGETRVTGVVMRMEPKDVEREIGWVIPSRLESGFKGKPVLIVRSIERIAK